MWVVLAGIASVAVVTMVALVRYDDPTAIVTALGPVAGVIGTLVGAYFGLRGSSLAQQSANAADVARAQIAAGTPPTLLPNGQVITGPTEPAPTGSG
jgi:hypothetical protein